MAKRPQTTYHKGGFKAPGADFGKEMLPTALALVGAAALVAGVACFTLKSSIIKPGRILDAAEDTGLYDKLPRLMTYVVLAGPTAKTLKNMGIKEAELSAMAKEALPEDWLAGQVEDITYTLADAIDAGEKAELAINLSDVKADLASALGDLLEENIERIPDCKGGQTPERHLCRPKGASDAQVALGLRDAVRASVDQIRSPYPLLDAASSEGIEALTGVIGALGTVGTLLILLALGAGVGVYFTRGDAQGPLARYAGFGAVGAAGVLLVVVFGIRSTVMGNIEAAVRTLEAGTASALSSFFSSAVGGGFTVAMIVMAVCAAGGGVLIYMTQE